MANIVVAVADTTRILLMMKTYGKKSKKSQTLRFPSTDPATILDDAFSQLNLKDPVNWQPRSKERTIEAPVAAFREAKKALEVTKELSDILKVIKSEGGTSINVTDWHTALESLSLEKIAEASYAQVYRATNKASATSILKVMQLELKSDPTSWKNGTAATLESILPEIKITNELSRIEGFVDLKGIYILVGNPPQEIVEAYERFDTSIEESTFPHPNTCTAKSAFLLLEQADAGVVLEDFKITKVEDFEEIFIGVLKPLALAEKQCGFEHRDLHENNVCVLDSSGHPKVTLLDYGLSYCGSINCYKDLELDLDIFSSLPEPDNELQDIQFKTYRRMRWCVHKGEMSPSMDRTKELWPKSALKGNWDRPSTATNVLWLYYILVYLTDKIFHQLTREEGRHPDSIELHKKYRELADRMRPEVAKKNKNSFCSAYEVLIFCIEQGWFGISEEEAKEIRGLDQGDAKDNITGTTEEEAKEIRGLEQGDVQESTMVRSPSKSK